jgi:CubicO group peptidase (beta-lactamase class C family)
MLRLLIIKLDKFTFMLLMTSRLLSCLFMFTLLANVNACKKSLDLAPAQSLSDFKNKIGSLQAKYKILGLIAGVSRNGQMVWSKPYGYADKEGNKPVTNSSLFHLASLTKTFGALTIMQLVEQGLVNLDDPVSNYGINLGSPGVIRVKHLLSHTSEATPGSQFIYNGDRYALLDKVIYNASGLRFDQWVKQKVFTPLGLQNVAPNLMTLANQDGYDTTVLKNNLVQGYSQDGKTRLDYPKVFSCAAGLIATMDDIIKYSNALDNTGLVGDSYKNQMWTGFVSSSGQTLPYGYGWFVQMIENKKVLWHYGQWTGISALIVKVPEQKITFVVLANSDMLSSAFDLVHGDVMNSPYAKLFLSSFVLNGAKL